MRRCVALCVTESWVAHVGCRVRDEGHVFHAEVFVVPVGPEVSVEKVDSLRVAVQSLDWKLDDVVVSVVPELPEGVRVAPRGMQPGE